MKSQIVVIFEADLSPMQILNRIKHPKDIEKISFLAIQYNGMTGTKEESLEYFYQKEVRKSE